MKRAFVFALALIGTACEPAPPVYELTPVNLYWEFERNTFIDGVPGFVPYDQDVNLSRCQQSGVDYVVVTDGFGNLVGAPTVPCAYQGIQGATFGVPIGRQTFRVQGYRNGRPGVALYDGQVTVDILAGPAVPVTVIAPGVAFPLTVTAILSQLGVTYPTCGLAGVQFFDATLKDGLGTVVWQNSVPCPANATPGVSYGPVDLDSLAMWMDAVDTRAGLPGQIIWSVCEAAIEHFGPQAFSLPLPMMVCQPGP